MCSWHCSMGTSNFSKAEKEYLEQTLAEASHGVLRILEVCFDVLSFLLLSTLGLWFGECSMRFLPFLIVSLFCFLFCFFMFALKASPFPQVEREIEGIENLRIDWEVSVGAGKIRAVATTTLRMGRSSFDNLIQFAVSWVRTCMNHVSYFWMLYWEVTPPTETQHFSRAYSCLIQVHHFFGQSGTSLQNVQLANSIVIVWLFHIFPFCYNRL